MLFKIEILFKVESDKNLNVPRVQATLQQCSETRLAFLVEETLESLKESNPEEYLTDEQGSFMADLMENLQLPDEQTVLVSLIKKKDADEIAKMVRKELGNLVKPGDQK